MAYFHQPVLLAETLEALNVASGKVFLDGTLGGGGHAFEILKATAPKGKLLGIDRDPDAVKAATERLKLFAKRFKIVAGSYAQADELARESGFEKFDGVLLDLGISSWHVSAEDKRGFSFKGNESLDMRFGPDTDLTAADILNNWPVHKIEEMLRLYGEVQGARKIAERLTMQRKIKPFVTAQDLVKAVVPEGFESWTFRPKIHPATKIFQALRIAVNSELDVLKTALPVLFGLLNPGGRLVIITYHSLEDRIVKDFFRQEARECLCDKRIPVCRCGHKRSLKIINSKPILPTRTEIINNPRSRSAKLRIAQKL